MGIGNEKRWIIVLKIFGRKIDLVKKKSCKSNSMKNDSGRGSVEITNTNMVNVEQKLRP